METTAVFTFSFPETTIPYSFQVSGATREEAIKSLVGTLTETIQKLQSEVVE